jgi:hypothetical protein
VALELMVDPHSSGEAPQRIGVMLWTTGADPHLLKAEVFGSAGELREWLRGIAAEHGPRNISVRWSKKLKAATTVAGLVAACLAVEVPGD